MTIRHRLLLVSYVGACLFLSGCGVGNPSSLKAANEILSKYPGAEVKEWDKTFAPLHFYVRTVDGTILSIIFADNGKMLAPEVIFVAR
jgi:hypothetical protein